VLGLTGRGTDLEEGIAAVAKASEKGTYTRRQQVRVQLAGWQWLTKEKRPLVEIMCRDVLLVATTVAHRSGAV
jgi:hypothetical protein